MAPDLTAPATRAAQDTLMAQLPPEISGAVRQLQLADNVLSHVKSGDNAAALQSAASLFGFHDLANDLRKARDLLSATGAVDFLSRTLKYSPATAPYVRAYKLLSSMYTRIELDQLNEDRIKVERLLARLDPKDPRRQVILGSATLIGNVRWQSFETGDPMKHYPPMIDIDSSFRPRQGAQYAVAPNGDIIAFMKEEVPEWEMDWSKVYNSLSELIASYYNEHVAAAARWFHGTQSEAFLDQKKIANITELFRRNIKVVTPPISYGYDTDLTPTLKQLPVKKRNGRHHRLSAGGMDKPQLLYLFQSYGSESEAYSALADIEDEVLGNSNTNEIKHYNSTSTDTWRPIFLASR